MNSNFVPHIRGEDKKFVLINIADILTIVGLLMMVTDETHYKKVNFHNAESFIEFSPSTMKT